jgi:two-component system chemotaxis response regulator CheB
LPILITQHIARGFVNGMVRWLDEAAPLKVKLAEHGASLQPSTVYVAGDDRHLTVLPDRTIALTEDPPSDGHRPSATVLFRSVAQAFGPKALAVVLTGMGRDGADGLDAVHRAGGLVFAQDEPSSAVFGMPKAAIDAGLTDLVLSLDAIADQLTLTAMPAPSCCCSSNTIGDR